MKCKVCGARMKLKAQDRYEVVVKPVGLTCLTTGVKVYEAFDCSNCGCQNIVNIREVSTEQEVEDDENND